MTTLPAKGKIIKVRQLNISLEAAQIDDLYFQVCPPHVFEAACVGGVSSGGVRLKYREEMLIRERSK
jgi:hypothetical protein